MSGAGQVTVAGADEIFGTPGAQEGGTPITIKNPTGGADVYLAYGTTAAATDFLLEGGESITLHSYNAAIYGYCATSQVVHWIVG